MAMTIDSATDPRCTTGAATPPLTDRASSRAHRALRYAFGFAGLIAVVVGALPASAQFGTPRPGARQPTGESLVAVDVRPSTSTIAAGSEFEIEVAFRIEPQWHIYWRNAGASGMPTEIRVKAPDGFEIGEVRWPTPRSFAGEEGITYGYEDGVALFVPVRAPSTVPEGPFDIDLSIDWLVCRGICLMGSTRRTLTLNDGAEPRELPAIIERIITSSRASIPQPIAKLEHGVARIDGDQVVIEGAVGRQIPSSAFRFFPIESPGVTTRQPQVEIADERFKMTIPIEVRPENSLGKPLTIGGVIAIASAWSYEFMLDAAPKPEADGAP